jgi:hypothetical protein
VTVLTPSTSRSISIWPEGLPWDGAATITLTAGQTSKRMLWVGVGTGEVEIRNNSTAPITLVVDLNAWLAP